MLTDEQLIKAIQEAREEWERVMPGAAQSGLSPRNFKAFRKLENLEIIKIERDEQRRKALRQGQWAKKLLVILIGLILMLVAISLVP